MGHEDRRFGGESNREIVSFRSCVRASGRGEAKLRERVRQMCFLSLFFFAISAPGRGAARRALGGGDLIAIKSSSFASPDR